MTTPADHVSEACCCNCDNQFKLLKHPTNKNIQWRGSISVQLAWVCKPSDPDFHPTSFIMDHEHGLCEMHVPVDYSRYTDDHAWHRVNK